MHLVLFVIEAEGVHGDVHAQPDRLLALQFAARADLEFPGAERVARQGADQVIARIENCDAAAELEALQIGRGEEPARGAVEQIERFVQNVIARDARERGAVDDARHQGPRRLLESAAARRAGVVDEEEAAVGEIAAE